MLALRRFALGKSVMPIGKTDGRLYGHGGLHELSLPSVKVLNSIVKFFPTPDDRKSPARDNDPQIETFLSSKDFSVPRLGFQKVTPR